MSINGIRNLKVTGQKYLSVYNKINNTNHTSILQTKKMVSFVSKDELKYAPINDIYHLLYKNQKLNLLRLHR